MPNDKVILLLQITGFMGATGLLCFLHGWPQVLFSSAFAVHFIGDMFRARKDRVIP